MEKKLNNDLNEQEEILQKYAHEFSDWVARDLALLRADDWGALYKSKHEKKEKDKEEENNNSQLIRAWRRNVPQSHVKCFKVEGHIETTREELRDLLDVHLVERQKEWHVLFIQGRILAALPANQEGVSAELCYMEYSSPSKIVSPRFCVYIKVSAPAQQSAKSDEHEAQDTQGDFICTYRSVPVPSLEEKEGFERTDILIGAHLIEKCEETSGCTLSYIQQATPGGRVPVWLSNMSQVGIIMEEFENIRKATHA